MFETSLAREMLHVLMDERYSGEKEVLAAECRKTKLWQLWEILFETDVQNCALLESRIYEYGSQIKENDYIHREIFVCLVAFLNLVIKQKTW